MMRTHRVALTTGASGRLGAGLVAGYRRRDWAVVASSRTIEPSPEPGLIAVPGDLTEPATADRIVDAALDRFGRVDTLVNNANACIRKPFTRYTHADYAAVAGVGLTGFFWLTQRAIGEMAVRYGGHVVTVSAAADGIAGAGPPAVLGALIEGGVAAATRSLAIEYASRGIRVNAVFPRVVDPARYPASGYDGHPDAPPPLGRLGQIADVVDGVLFLEASTFITGQILRVDGGTTACESAPGG
jgi:NAD(P)-dependent dehydrogenase (short-subunit alcohol dehydrogenase family)